jgi:hypothetical protein
MEGGEESSVTPEEPTTTPEEDEEDDKDDTFGFFTKKPDLEGSHGVDDSLKAKLGGSVYIAPLIRFKNVAGDSPTIKEILTKYGDIMNLDRMDDDERQQVASALLISENGEPNPNDPTFRYGFFRRPDNYGLVGANSSKLPKFVTDGDFVNPCSAFKNGKNLISSGEQRMKSEIGISTQSRRNDEKWQQNTKGSGNPNNKRPREGRNAISLVDARFRN